MPTVSMPLPATVSLISVKEVMLAQRFGELYLPLGKCTLLMLDLNDTCRAPLAPAALVSLRIQASSQRGPSAIGEGPG